MNKSEGSNVDMSYNGPQVALYRPPSRGAVPYEEWKDDASCKGEDPDLFELQDPESISEDDQHELIAWGLKICVNCPVKKTCLSEASEEDKHWTTRGGQPPEGLFPDADLPKFATIKTRKGGFAPGMGPVRPLLEKCRKGHKEWSSDERGKRRCLACRREQNRKDWLKRKKRT